MRLPIHLQREIARLHFYDTSQSNRAIARSVGVSANTVREMRRILRKSDTFGADLCKTACKTFQISGVISVQKLPPWVV